MKPTHAAQQWDKLPSVTRHGKSFYRRAPFTVLQSFLSGRWYYTINHGAQIGDFRTAKEAMRAVDAL